MHLPFVGTTDAIRLVRDTRARRFSGWQLDEAEAVNVCTTTIGSI